MSSVNIVAVKMAQEHKVLSDTGVQTMQMVVQHHQ